ncbi:MAG: ABC transporter ATP-binding protein [Terracidiphilus sp.]
MIAATENLSKTFGRFDALMNVNLRVPEGSVFALVGTNGAGKTTTIQLLLNMIAPTWGTASVLGVDSRRLTTAEWSQIGYVSENQQMPRQMTVSSYIRYLRPLYTTWDRSLESAILQQLSLPPKRRIKDLSHGMRMKMALACALPFRPRFLVLDEPFSGLDPLVREEFMYGLLRRADQTTILVSSHELSELDGLATHLALLDRGKLVCQETITTVKNRVREVRITLDPAPHSLPALPGTWADVHIDGGELSFIDTDHSERQLGLRINSMLPGVQRVEVHTVPLRSAVTSLLRSARAGNA